MWKRNKDEEEKERPSQEYQVKYPKPKVLLVDLPPSCLDSVRAAGFNALAGTFGSPYKVEIEDEYAPVIANYCLPDYTEQEIMFIDLTPPETIESCQGEKMVSEQGYELVGTCSIGKIDPRPFVMYRAKDRFDRVLRHGGVFVIFAQERQSQTMALRRIQQIGYYRLPGVYSEREHDSWSFLSILSQYNVTIEQDFGREISLHEYARKILPEICPFLERNIKNAIYTATFHPSQSIGNNWIPLLNSKFGDCVGGLIVPDPKHHRGFALILPQIPKKDKAILALLREVLPDICPRLFPHIEGAKWVERNEYELDSILKCKEEKVEVQQRAKRELEELDKKILEERSKLGFLHGMLTKTGYNLVLDVKSCLEFIGFKQVTDVDAQMISDSEQENPQRQEDLQIHDKSPILLVEIKGLSDLPRESDVIQVVKYVARRMREWERTDVRGVSIMNHHRNRPALDRDNENVWLFRLKWGNKAFYRKAAITLRRKLSKLRKPKALRLMSLTLLLMPSTMPLVVRWQK